MKHEMDKTQPNFTITPELLQLQNISIEAVYFLPDGSLCIKVESTQKEVLCQYCKYPTEPNGKNKVRRLQHLSLLGRAVYIEIETLRGLCKQCDQHPTTTQLLPWYKLRGQYTTAYEDYLLLQIISSTLVDVAKKEGQTEERLQAILDRHIGGTCDFSKIGRIGLLGIDEIAQLKGYDNYVTIITSRYHDKTRILAIVEGKEKAAVKAFLSRIPHKKRKTITAACVDMCDSYINAIKETFGVDVPVIVDRFHVAQLSHKRLNELRSSELKRLKQQLSEEDYKALKPAIKLLIKKYECYSKKDKIVLASLFKHSPAIKAAYRLVRELTHIYNKHYRPKTAQKKLTRWLEKINASDVRCLNSFANTVSKYQTEICGYFMRRETSGWVEGTNNKIKVIKRRCYGLSNLKHFFQRVFLDLEGYAIFLPKQSVRATA
jgi:transposase